MRHHLSSVHGRENGETVRRLCDGRRLVMSPAKPAILVGVDGDEMTVSGSELKALIAISEMTRRLS